MSAKTRTIEKRDLKRKKQEQLDMQRKIRTVVIWTGVLVVIVLIGLLVFQRANAPGTDFKLAEQPGIGNADAPVTIVEFGDFKCPSCQYFSQIIYPQLKKDYIDTGKVRLYFVNYPFIGPDSTTAAQAAEAVFHQKPDAFWGYYDDVYKKQGPETTNWATPETLVNLAKESAPGLDYDLLLKDIQNQTYSAQVKDDYKLGQTAGVSSTPTLYINGKAFLDFSNYPKLQQTIDQAGAK
jgi:protein-disulfide isomerase